MGNGLGLRPCERICQGKNRFQEEFHASKEKGSEKEKETLVAGERDSLANRSFTASREKHLSRGFLLRDLSPYPP
jgi:hypothetical protein